MARRNESEEEYEMLEAVPIDRDRPRGAEDDDLQDNEYLADLLGVLGASSNVMVTVSKQGERGKFDIIETYPVNDLTAETVNILREQYGAGVYRFRANKKGNRRSVWEKDYGFAELPRSHRHGAPAQASSPARAVSSEFEQLSRQMGLQTELLGKLVQALGERQAQPAGDSEERMLAKLGMYKQLFAPAASAPQHDPFDIFTRALGLAKDFAQPSEGSNTIDLVRDIVKGMSQYAAAAPVQPVLPKPATIQPQTQPALQRPVAMQEEIAMANPDYYYSFLIARAEKGEDPQQLAFSISENVAEHEVYAILDRPDLINEIIRQHPPAEKHRAWLEQLMSELNKIMYDETGEGEAP